MTSRAWAASAANCANKQSAGVSWPLQTMLPTSIPFEWRRALLATGGEYLATRRFSVAGSGRTPCSVKRLIAATVARWRNWILTLDVDSGPFHR